jgi:CheY-like chemotaxis protein
MDKLRILFVDDEARVLRSIRRALSLLDMTWETEFAENGRAALQLLDTAPDPYHVIVTDIRMPGMSGTQLLQQVKDSHPDMIRIVLTGQANLEDNQVFSAVELAHQYLTKPCDIETLETVLRQAQRLRDMLTGAELRQLISRIGSLPSPPALYAELMKEIDKPDASVRNLGTIMSQDMAMTAKVLQLVNSAYFGLRRRIYDPEQAVIYLGFETIRALALSVQIFSQYDMQGRNSALLSSQHRHAIAVGVVGRRIAEVERVDAHVAKQIFTAF